MIETTRAFMDTPSGTDVPAMAALRVATYQETDTARQQAPPCPYAVQLERVAENLPKRMVEPAAYFQVVRAGSEVVGMVDGSVETRAGGISYLGFLGMRPDFRGYGWGHRLVTAFIDRVGPDASIDLIAEGPDDERLRAFYQSFGFEPAGELGRMIRKNHRRVA